MSQVARLADGTFVTAERWTVPPVQHTQAELALIDMQRETMARWIIGAIGTSVEGELLPVDDDGLLLLVEIGQGVGPKRLLTRLDCLEVPAPSRIWMERTCEPGFHALLWRMDPGHWFERNNNTEGFSQEVTR